MSRSAANLAPRRLWRRRLLAHALVGLPVIAALAGAAWHPGSAQAQPAPTPTTPPAELAIDLPGARLQGTARMRFFGLHVYDIRLWTAAAAPATDPAQPPLALELIYGRKLVGEQIASRSIDEMRRIGSLSEAQATAWLAAMTRLFPDVKAGDRLTGVLRPDGVSRFHFNGQARGEIADADFGRLFFGIWLSPRTSEPRLREQLLGLAR